MTTRDLQGYNNAILDTFNIMRISTRQKLVGSASVVGNIITNDYDLNETVIGSKDTLKKVHQMFIKKFDTIYNSPTHWIVDFKSGQYNNEPIRWDVKDLKRGYKNIGGSRVRFVDCLIQSDTKTKLDVVLLLNNRFVEVSELYFIDVDGQANFSRDDFKIENLVKELSDDKNELIDEKNYFKALKREYRILSILHRDPKRQQVLTDLFNGQYGYLYYVISQLNTLIIMKQQKFRKVSDDIFLEVQQNIKDDISRVLNYTYANKKLDKKISVDNIERIITHITEYLNNYILDIV